MNEVTNELIFHESMIGDDGLGKQFLNKWAKRMIAKNVGFAETTEAYEKAILAITIAFKFGQKLIIDKYEIAIVNLISAIPSQTNDADWWPDELTDAVNEANNLVS